jgi:hypothetical protein
MNKISQPTVTEQRLAKRVNLDKLATMSIDQQLFTVRIINISETGLGVISAQPNELQKNIQTEIELLLSKQPVHLTLQGKIIHTTKVQNQYLLSIELCKLSEYSRRTISHYVAQHS